MRLTTESIEFINLFERVTKARVKDCLIEDGKVIFIVEEGQVRKSLGKDNINLEKIKRLTRKEIQVIGFSSNLVKFINNLLYPVRADNISVEDKVVLISSKDPRTKGKIFGRSKERLKWINDVVKKYFDIEEVKVV